MRIVVHDYVGYAFPAQLARALAARGHDVLHLHCTSFTAGKGRVAREPGDPPNVDFDSVGVGGAFAKYDLRRRVADERRTGAALAARVDAFRPDAVVSSNTPLFVQRAVLAAAHRRGAAFVFWQQDVIAAAARRVVGRRGRAAGAAAGVAVAVLERGLLRRSDGVVVIADDFVPKLRELGIPADRIDVIENWAPLSELPVRDRENDWARDHGLAGRTVFLYAGTLGFKHDPGALLELARGTAADVVVVSEGPGADWLREHGRGLPSLRLLGYQPYEQLPDVLASADVLVAILEPEAGRFSVPSKVLTYLCAGRAVLAAVPAENLAAQVIERSGGGIVVPPSEAGALVAAARRLDADPGLRAQLGAAARAYAERTFDVDRIARRFEDVLERAARTRRARS